MVYKIKQGKGRPRVTFKVRSISNRYFKPKGFKFHKFDRKKKAVIFKRIKL